MTKTKNVEGVVCHRVFIDRGKRTTKRKMFSRKKKKGQMTIPKSSQRRLNTQREIINHFARLLPSFNDLFDEQSWYIFFACLTVCSFLIAFILSRYVKLSDGGREKRTHPFVNVRRTRLF